MVSEATDPVCEALRIYFIIVSKPVSDHAYFAYAYLRTGHSISM